MNSVIKRGYVTDFLIQSLSDAGFIVGDAVAPDDGGWDGDPGASGSSYNPYVIVTPMTAGEPYGTLGDSSSEWTLPYSFNTNGVSRRQVEDVADDVRLLLSTIRKVKITMGSDTWRINQLTSTSMGQMSHTTAVDPTLFSQTDSMLVALSRSV